MNQNEPQAQTPPGKDMKLDLKDLLIAEFNYIASNVFQANEDRARVSSYYFVTAAAVVAAILGANLQNGSAWIYIGFMLLFAALSLIGYFTVLQLARLRIAWRSSADAMNEVVKYYIDHSSDLDVKKSLLWFNPEKNLPAEGRVESVSFLLALSVIATDFGTTVVSFVYGGQSIFALAEDQFISIPWWANLVLIGVALIPGFFFARFQIHEYSVWVRKQPDDKTASFLERTLKRLKLLQSLDSPGNLPPSATDNAVTPTEQKAKELEKR